MLTPEEKILQYLDQTYDQRADDRQKAMGLSYMEAETHDLAKNMAWVFDQVLAQTLKRLMGYVENGTETVVKMYQVDATRWYFIELGKTSYSDSTLLGALSKALADCE